MKKQYLLLLALTLTFSVNAQKKKNLSVNNIPTSQQLNFTSANERMKAFDQRKALEIKSLVNNVKFRSVGPTVMSGRVVDVDVNNQNPTEFFVAYASGGLWKTENNGISFSPLFDNEAVMTIGDIAVDWKTKGQTIWIGTGEANSSRSSYAGVGMYKSEDGGKTWQHKGLDETHHIGKVILHPTDPNTVWVAALGKLYTANKERGL
ncbi:MAG: glycosyl hydrolase, partial [Arcicella sp.]|nr:glycosyl hydrolase [Arcicella sp.]